MPSKKVILATVAGVVIIGGCILLSSHIKSIRQARQRELANVILGTVAQEGENCLKKLAGQHDRVAHTSSDFQTKIASCYLQRIGIDALSVSEDACLGIAQNTHDTDTFRIAAVKVNGADLVSDLCTGDVSLRFELETKPEGKALYDKMRTENQPNKPEDIRTLTPTTEGLAGANAFPEEIISRLDEAASK